MGFEVPKEMYKGKICEVSLGGLKIGGEEALPFYSFEGNIPNPPRIALEVYDTPPLDWPKACLEPYKDVVDDPIKWAKKCVHDYGAEIVCLQLLSTDPTTKDTSPTHAASLCKEVADAVSVPLVVYGTGKAKKDEEVLKKVAEACSGKDILIGPVVEENYKGLGAAAVIAYKQKISANTPVDVNLAKQLNIMLEALGIKREDIIMDPTASALGYGLEYAYSVIERQRVATLLQGDEKLGIPILVNIGKEVWKIKELQEEDPSFGDPTTRGILWEAITAFTLSLAGANLLIMRHPDAARLVKETTAELLMRG
jgi:acetyl-CoA decarbonylase/synthase complex subunit delta